MAYQRIFFITWPNHKIMKRNFQENFFGVSQDDLWCWGWTSISSGTVIIIQVWTWRTSGSWHISNHARELKFGEQTKNHIPWWSMRWLLTLSPKYPVRNLQCPPKKEGQKDLEKLSIVLESSALNLKGGVIKIEGVAVIAGTIFLC